MGDSITSGEGAIGAKPEEDWVGAFFSAENHYGRLTADALGAEYHLAKWLGHRDRLGQRCAPCDAALLTQVCGVAMGQRNAALPQLVYATR